MPRYTEDSLVQTTTADYFETALGWESVFAFDKETFGADGTLGRESKREIVLTRYLRQALEKLNPALPAQAYQAAIEKILEASVSKDLLQINREKYGLHRNGVLVEFRNDKGEIEELRLRLFDFKDATNNHFLVVRELWMSGATYNRRADIIGFVNGLPLLFIELKNIHKELRWAYDQNFTDYKDTVPHIFQHNAFVVLGNGDKGLIGSLSSRYEHFSEWKRLHEDEPGAVEFETLLKGVCSKQNFMDLLENFILFDETKTKLAKIVARNHQFLGVNRAIEAVRNRQNSDGKLGVFWHTQGSGKSYSMVYFAEKVRRKVEGDFTFVVLTDRDDLDTQIYKTFAGCGIVDNKTDVCRAGSGKHLEEILTANKPYVFAMIQKFNQAIEPDKPYTRREDVIVISDEAHRSQYGFLAKNMRDALPKANFIGFTGTPLFKDDEITKRYFGDYVSTYNFQRAVEDNATVPLYYDSRGEKLEVTTDEINEKVAKKIEEAELDAEQTTAVQRALGKDYQVFAAEKRLRTIAQDFVEHYTTRWESGKAMFVCLDKITTVRMLDFVRPLWQEKIEQTRRAVTKAADEQEEIFLRRKLDWLESTEMAVVISEEQNEVEKFRNWNIEIEPHRKLIKDGFVAPDGKKVALDDAFKDGDHPFRVVFVCAMWLTGFDVESLSTMYLDKPLKAHTLMQTIARANRVYAGKNNGLIIDYCGILKELRKALATFASGSTTKEATAEEVMELKPEKDLLNDLDAVIKETRAFLSGRGFRLEDIGEKEGFARIAAITQAKEAVNHSDETRKKFNILARELVRKYKACLNLPIDRQRREAINSIDIIEKKLKEDHKKADVSQILKELHDVVNEAIGVEINEDAPESQEYDISKIDFERLKEEFAKSPRKNSTVQALKDVIEKQLDVMLRRNPRRISLYERYQQIINEYNEEKDRLTIEMTFEELMKLTSILDEEEKRAMRENLDEETLALFDLLLKESLSTPDRNRLKKVAVELLDKLKAERLNIQNWYNSEANKANVHTFIYDFLYAEQTGLPSTYSKTEIKEKSDLIFSHVYQQYSATNRPQNIITPR